MRKLKKALEIFVSGIPSIPEPKVSLEQYASPPHLVSRLLWIAEMVFGDVVERKVIDLGSGTGRLGLAAAYLGAMYVLMMELDLALARVSWDYAKTMGFGGMTDVICGDARLPPLRRAFDTAIQNPPFGVHKRGADVVFLKAALSLARVVYSVHKAETIDFIVSKVREMGGYAEPLFEEEVLIPSIMNFHFKRRHRVKVVVVRVASRKD